MRGVAVLPEVETLEREELELPQRSRSRWERNGMTTVGTLEEGARRDAWVERWELRDRVPLVRDEVDAEEMEDGGAVKRWCRRDGGNVS